MWHLSYRGQTFSPALWYQKNKYTLGWDVAFWCSASSTKDIDKNVSDQQVYSIFGIIKWGSKVLKVRVAEGVTNFFKLPFIPSAYVHRIWSNVYYVNTFFFYKKGWPNASWQMYSCEDHSFQKWNNKDYSGHHLGFSPWPKQAAFRALAYSGVQVIPSPCTSIRHPISFSTEMAEIWSPATFFQDVFAYKISALYHLYFQSYKAFSGGI